MKAFLNSKIHISHVCTIPEYAIRCSEVKGSLICHFHVTYIHINGGDAHTYPVVLNIKDKEVH